MLHELTRFNAVFIQKAHQTAPLPPPYEEVSLGDYKPIEKHEGIEANIFSAKYI